jgi:HK97 family phage major capsid protein
MGSTVPGGGAETVFESQGDLIELLVPQTVLIQMGVGVSTGLSGPIAHPKETGDVDAYWTSENPPAPVADTEQAFGIVQLSPRTLMATMKWPRQLLALASIDMEARGRMRMTSKIGRMLDIGGLHGSGAGGQVTGIFNTPGVAASDDLSGVADYADLLEMVGAVAAVEGDTLGTQGWLTTPEYAAALASKEKASGYPVYLWGTDPGTIRQSSLVGYTARASNQMSKTLGSGDKHGLLYGTFGTAEFALWGALEVIVDDVTLATYGQVRMTCFQMADFAVRYPEAFIKGTGAKP